MNSVQLKASLVLKGYGIGVSGSPDLANPIRVRRSSSMQQNGSGATLANSFINKANEAITLGVGTTDIDLTSFTDALGATAQSLARVRVLFFEHDADSDATSVTLFNAASNSFQGPISAGASIALLPGEEFFQRARSTGGWVVDGTHKTLRIVVAGDTATLRYFIGGSTT